MKHKRLRKMLAFIIVIVLMWGIVIYIDYFRAKQQQDPIFSFRTIVAGDGGTTIEYGIGYKVIHYREMEEYGGRKDIVFKFGW